MHYKLNLLFLITDLQFNVVRKTQMRQSVANKINFKKHQKNVGIRVRGTDKRSIKLKQTLVRKISRNGLEFEGVELVEIVNAGFCLFVFTYTGTDVLIKNCVGETELIFVS